MDQLLLILAVLASPGMVCETAAASKPRRPDDKPNSEEQVPGEIVELDSQEATLPVRQNESPAF